MQEHSKDTLLIKKQKIGHQELEPKEASANASYNAAIQAVQSALAQAAAPIFQTSSSQHSASDGALAAGFPLSADLNFPVAQLPSAMQIHVLNEADDHIANETKTDLELQSMNMPRPVPQYVVECGQVDKNGVRRMTAFSPFFGKEVQIYTVAGDPEKRVLYRASALAEKFGCATNKIGMYLARRRNGSDGIYQASRLVFKPSGRTGLKTGGYFVTFPVCKAFEAHYKQQVQRKPRPALQSSDQQSYMFSQLSALYANHLGPTTTPVNPRIPWQQQVQLFQLARLKMSQMNHQFKGVSQTPQFANPSSSPGTPVAFQSPPLSSVSEQKGDHDHANSQPEMRAYQQKLQQYLQNQARAAYIQQMYSAKQSMSLNVASLPVEEPRENSGRTLP